MGDFLASAFKKIRAHCKDGLDGEPITEDHPDAEPLARRAAGTASGDFLCTMDGGDGQHAKPHGVTLQ